MREDMKTWILTGFFAFVLPLAGLLWFLLGPASPTGPTPPAAVCAEFRRRRRRTLRYGYPFEIVGVAMVLASIFLLSRDDLPGLLGSPMFAFVIMTVGGLVFLVAHAYMDTVYRCPVCGDVLSDRMSESGGWLFDARTCPSCKASFE